MTSPDDHTTDDTFPPRAAGDEHVAPLGLSRDVTLTLLADERRREIIRFLLDVDRAVDMRALAEHVAARENDTTPEKLADSEHHAAYVSMYHALVPSLHEYGVVEYNRECATVSPGEHLPAFEPYLEGTCPDCRNDGSTHFYGAGAAGVAGVVLVAAAGPVAVSALVVGVAVTSLFLLTMAAELLA